MAIVLACLTDVCSITCSIIPVQSKRGPGVCSWWDSWPGVVILSSHIVRKIDWLICIIYTVFTVSWYEQYCFGIYN